MTKLAVFQKWSIPILIIAVTFITAVYLAADYFWLLMAMLLFLPLLDRSWVLPRPESERRALKYSVTVLLLLLLLLFFYVSSYEFILYTIFIVALPEEWFFRAYLLNRLGGHYKANVISSVLFSILHAVTRGPATGLEVFVPSLLFGFIYQKTGSLLLCVLVHGLSNVLYALLLHDYFELIRAWLGYSV